MDLPQDPPRGSYGGKAVSSDGTPVNLAKQGKLLGNGVFWEKNLIGIKAKMQEYAGGVKGRDGGVGGGVGEGEGGVGEVGCGGFDGVYEKFYGGGIDRAGKGEVVGSAGGRDINIGVGSEIGSIEGLKNCEPWGRAPAFDFEKKRKSWDQAASSGLRSNFRGDVQPQSPSMLYEPISKTRVNLATASSKFPRNPTDPTEKIRRAKTRPRNSAVTNYYNNFLNTNCPDRQPHNQSSNPPQNRPQKTPKDLTEKFFDKYASGKYLPTPKNAPHSKSVKFSDNFFIQHPLSLTNPNPNHNPHRFSLTPPYPQPRSPLTPTQDPPNTSLIDDIFTVKWNKTYNSGQKMGISDYKSDFSHPWENGILRQNLVTKSQNE